MSTVSIHLPEKLKRLAWERAAASEHSSLEEYVQALILADAAQLISSKMKHICLPRWRLLPVKAEGLAVLAHSRPQICQGGTHPNIAEIPNDPWGHQYIYRSPGTSGKDYDLFSAGPDGRPGTADDVNMK